jgi:hypothetical protein
MRNVIRWNRLAHKWEPATDLLAHDRVMRQKAKLHTEMRALYSPTHRLQ